MSKPRASGDAEIAIPLQGRTLRRTMGCWNCVSFDNGEKAKQHFEACKTREMLNAAEVAKKDPRGINAPKVQQIASTMADAERSVQAGVFGICLAGGVQSDFVHNAHLCPKWRGKQGASVARAGARADDLPAEVKDKLGDEPEK